MPRAREYSWLPGLIQNAARLDPEQLRRRVRVHHVCLPRFQIVDLQDDAPPNYPRLQHGERIFCMIWPMILLAWLASSASSALAADASGDPVAGRAVFQRIC